MVERETASHALLDLPTLADVRTFAAPSGPPHIIREAGGAGVAAWFTPPSAEPGVWLDLDTGQAFRLPDPPWAEVVHGSVVQPLADGLLVWGGRTSAGIVLDTGWTLRP